MRLRAVRDWRARRTGMIVAQLRGFVRAAFGRTGRTGLKGPVDLGRIRSFRQRQDSLPLPENHRCSAASIIAGTAGSSIVGGVVYAPPLTMVRSRLRRILPERVLGSCGTM